MAEAYGDSRNNKPKSSSSSSSVSKGLSTSAANKEKIATKKSSGSSGSSKAKSPGSSGGSSGSGGSGRASAGAAAERAAAAAKAKKVAEMKALGDSVTKAGTSLEKSSNLLVAGMQELWKGLTGNTADTINKICNSAQDYIETEINKINSIGKDISQKIKNEGENYNFNNFKANTERTSNSNKDKTFGIDTNYLTNNVKPLFDSAKKAIKDAWNEISNSPKVDGYKDVSGESEEINIIEKFIDGAIDLVNEINEAVEKAENEAKAALGNLMGKMLGGVVPEASASEWVEPNKEQTDNTDVVKGLSTDAARDEKFAAKEEERRKETMAKESSTDAAREEYLATRKFNKEYELQELIENSNLNPKNNGLIAHRGFGDEENTAQAVKNAGEAGYWGCETDVRFDSNGNVVCSHDSVGGGETPLSLEEYLKICKEYGMTPVLDIKYEDGNGDQNNKLAQEIIKITDSLGMTATTVLQTDRINDISNIRGSSESVQIWYLANGGVSSIDTDVIKDNNVGGINIKDATGKSTTNAQQIEDIQELVGEDVDICVWNVTTEATKDKILSSGATYVMSDNKLGVTPYQEGDIDFNLVNGKYNANSSNKENVGILGDSNIIEGLSTDDARKEYLATRNFERDEENQRKETMAKESSTDATRKEYLETRNFERDEQKRKETMAKESSTEFAREEKLDEIRLEQLQTEKEKLLANDIYDSSKDNSVWAQSARDRVEEIEREQLILVAKNNGIKTEGKSYSEVVTEFAKKLEIETTKEVTIEYDGEILTARAGRIEYDRADGVHVQESWCGLTYLDEVIEKLKKFEGDKMIDGQYIKDLEYHIREEDGVQMLGDYVIVATDVISRRAYGVDDDLWLYEDGGTYYYGDPVETTLGRGIVVDQCSQAHTYRRNNGDNYTNLEVYTLWDTPGVSGRVRADDYVPANNANNPKLEETVKNKTTEELADEIKAKILNTD